MNTDFQWLCLIYEDQPKSQPGIEATCQRLEAAGIVVKIVVTPTDFTTGVNDIISADLILCDLKFTNFGSFDVPTCAIPDELSSPNITIEGWVQAIRAWSSTEDKRDWPTDQIPRAQIAESDVGFWLAAMTSRVNPDVQIVFYTSAVDVTQGPVAAIGLFKDAQFAVETKDPSVPISESAIWGALERRQRRLLHRLPAVYQWFLRRVILPILVDGQPRIGNAVQLSTLNLSQSYVVRADYFFPQLRNFTSKETKVGFLARFLINGRWTLPEWQRQALHSLEHDLRPEAVVGCQALNGAEREGFVEGLCSSAIDAGTVGQQALVLLEMTLEQIRIGKPWNLVQDLLNRARDACLSASRNSERDLETACESFTSLSCRSHGTVVVDDSIAVAPHGRNADPVLPFPVASLRRAASALRHNMQTYRDLENSSERHCLYSKITAESLVVCWSDDSKGFESFEDFKNAVLVSVAKRDAESRGLPLAILFGIEFGASAIDVLIRGANTGQKVWHRVFPDGTTETADSSTGTWNYAIRWTFGHTRGALP